MKILKVILLIIALLIALFGLFLLFSTIIDYKPNPVEIVFETTSSVDILPTAGKELSMVIWNIGYGGLDSSMDFFYDGGQHVRPSKAGVSENVDGILATLKSFDDFDFVMLQEVDRRSKRSYRTNQYSIIGDSFPDYFNTFGSNYRVWFVPVPIKSPMGRVDSGLQTLSSRTPMRVERHSFPGNYAWPLKLYMLDRCFLVNYYPLDNGKELLVINTHNSAYDDGSLRSGQMAYLKDFVLEEYAAGNYVIVGGDWNQCPPGFEPLFEPGRFDRDDLTYIDDSFPDASWSWAYDASVPTNRRVKTAYDPQVSPVTVIDLFLVSPNVRILEVEGMDLGFEFSDHQPVTLKVVLD